MPKFAVNYSPLLAEMVRAGQVRVDRFKCPAWPDLLEEARRAGPLYVHFPLGVGSGAGGPVDEEIKGLADLDHIERMVDLTGTPYVNTHFIPTERNYPDIPAESTNQRHVARVVSNTLRDLEPLIRRFGAERVLVENVINEYGYLTIAALPEVLARILEETGCGLLFDLSHARLSAWNLGIPEREYCAALPVEKIREVHVTGIQLLDGELWEKFQATVGSNGFLGMAAGHWMDHFPMTPADWTVLEWMAGQISNGRKAGDWHEPWVVAFEYGGVGGFWEMITDREVYLEQLPRMAAIVRKDNRRD